MTNVFPIFKLNHQPQNATMKLYAAYDTVEPVGLECTEAEGRTQQQFADDADINVIVRRFGLTGELPTNLQMPVSGDFADAMDFQQSMNLIARAKAEFLTLPADLRTTFNNDPGQLIQFMENPNNRQRAIELGLIPKPTEQTRDEPPKV